MAQKRILLLLFLMLQFMYAIESNESYIETVTIFSCTLKEIV